MLAALALRADEPPPATDDTIAKAKRDYEVIKAAKAGPEQPAASALPSTDQASIDLHLTADLPAPSTSPNAPQNALDTSTTGRKSVNWLLDAMADPKDRNHAMQDPKDPFGLRLAAPGAKSGETDLLAQDRALAREKQASADRAERALGQGDKQPASAATPNPLNRYMAEWMTPQDLALLNPKAATAGNSVPAGSPLAGPGDEVAAAGSAVPDLSIPGSESPGFTAGLSNTLPVQPAKENPYLAELALPAPPSPTNAPAYVPMQAPNLLSPTPAPSLFAPVTPQTPQAQPGVSPLLEQVQKAQDDAKYFKQLKRF